MLRISGSCLAVLSLAALPTLAQTNLHTVARDPQALAILGQFFQASGGSQAVASIQDYTAFGTVEFNWGGQQVQGTVAVKGRGGYQFRMDATTSEGNENWIVDGLIGALFTPDGRQHSIPPYNLENAGTLPIFRITNLVNQSATTVQYMDEITENGRSAFRIRLIPPIPHDLALIAGLNDPGTIDLLIDSSTHELLSETETFCGTRDTRQTYTHELEFSNYHMTNGLLVPYGVEEKVSGQLTWSMTLSTIEFNVGLTDADFATSTQ